RQRGESAEKEEQVESERAPLRFQRRAHGVQEPEPERGPEQPAERDRAPRREEEGEHAPHLAAQHRVGIEPEQMRCVRPRIDEQVQRTGEADDPEEDPLGRVAVALTFWWPLLESQVRVEGRAVKIPSQEADKYFATRPRLSQIGAWASDQSTPLRSREELERRFEEISRKYEGAPIPRPP